MPRFRLFASTYAVVPLVAMMTSEAAWSQSVTITASGFSQYWGTSNPNYDLNGDGIVNGGDLAIFLAQSSGDSQSGSGTGTNGSSGNGTELDTPFAATPDAAGPQAPIFYRNASGSSAPQVNGGSGFGGATQLPSLVGASALPGTDARAIARWDFIPYRTIQEPTNVGVVAFHINGIDRVSFSANGGPWVDVRTMERNPQTGVWEYYITLDPSSYPDGRVELRAIVYPTVGKPRVLQGPLEGNQRDGMHSMVLWTNGNRTLKSSERWVSLAGSDLNDGLTEATAMRTISKAAASIHLAQQGNAGGGFINVLPGEYAWSGAGKDQFGATVANPATTERWLTVRRAPGHSGEVTFTSHTDNGAVATKLLCVESLRFVGGKPSRGGSVANGLIWIGNCELRGGSTSEVAQFIDVAYAGGYLTQTAVGNCVTGVSRAFLIRDVHINQIGNDAVSSIPLVLNCTVRNITRPAGQNWHCDVLQFAPSATPRQNVIVFGLKAFDNRSQGLIARDGVASPPVVWKDFALVNAFIEFSQGSNHTTQWRISTDHLLVWNCGFIGGPFLMRGSESDGSILNYSNVSFRGNVFTNFNLGVASTSGIEFLNNHFVEGTAFGALATTGNPRYAAPESNDYRPLANSPLVNRIESPMVSIDSALNVVEAPGNVGSFED